MLQVELDIFSGRPNPLWILSGKEEKELLDRITAEPKLMLPTEATSGRLGYRGYIVSPVSEDPAKRLPTSFRIGGQPGVDKEVNLWLLDTSEKMNTEVDDYLREIASGMIRKDERMPGHGEALPDKGSLATCGSNFFTSSSDFSFWNGATVVRKNNCYNFASNYRSNTFAQPGKQTGHQLGFPPTCANAGAGVRSDGWADSCRASNNLTACLVIWPGNDYHFYRKCSGGLWCHKPGQTPARNTDDSGNLITNPQTANRGPYTTFCEYFYVTNGSIIVS
jgi:hypothetical protein